MTLGSRVMFPASYITFGVLHGIALALIVMRLSAGAGRWLWPLGLVALLLPQFIQHPFFDTRWTNCSASSRSNPSPKTMCRCFRGWA